MRKLIAFIVLGFLGTFSYAQEKNNLTPVLKNEKATYTQKGSECVTHFQLTATADQIEALKKHAATMTPIKLDIIKTKGNNYNCTLTVNNPAGTQYTQRIFIFLGFEKFNLDGNDNAVNELANTLNKLK